MTEPAKFPPKVGVAFRVGIVGHRLNRLPRDPAKLAALQAVLHDILDAARQAVTNFRAQNADAQYYSDVDIVLRAISPLAEGSDRMFARAAIPLGYALTCPMPFDQSEFEKDFEPPDPPDPDDPREPDSVMAFRRLLDQARNGAGLTVFELDGARGPKAGAEAEAYGAAGRVVLNQSDLLVVVWDGKEAAGGGTVQTLQEALTYNVPVLWIDANNPDHWQHLQGEGDLLVLKAPPSLTPSGVLTAQPDARRADITKVVSGIVRDALALPGQEKADNIESNEKRSCAADYFAERQRHLNFAFAWKLFRDLVGRIRIRLPRILVRNFAADTADWPIASDKNVTTPPSFADWVNVRLRDHYAWADGLADFCADHYRSAYVLSYLFAAVAVLVALLPGVMDWHGCRETACIATELGLLAFILISLWRGYRHQWHNRWMEYRLLAEMIRQLRFLIPLGGGHPTPHMPAHLAAFGKPTRTWMYWHVRAIARAAGIPEARVTPDYVLGCLDYVGNVIGTKKTGQWAFHLNTEAISINIHKRLHLLSLTLFILTILCILTHLAIQLKVPHVSWLEPHRNTLVLLCAALPAFGAAFAGINNQGEFARLAKRSAGMASDFSAFSIRIGDLRARADAGDDPKLADIVPLATEIAGIMVEEVVDWRVLFVDRPQTA